MHTRRARIRVLVAESNPHLRSVLSWSLAQDARFQVVAEVSDGDEAASCTADFDVALLDLSISGLGGPGTLARLQQRRPAPAVVLISGTDAVYLRHAAAAEGAADFLVRPLEPPVLADRLVTAVARTAPLAKR